MADARTAKSRAAIKRALLRLLDAKPLELISMSELAKEARVSRSTLYLHYANIQLLFDEMVADFQDKIMPLDIHLRCIGCDQPSAAGRIPFCVALRNAGKYAPLVKSSRYLQSMVKATSQGPVGATALKSWTDAGLTEEMAQRMYTFQMSACYAMAMATPEDEDWPAVQGVVDRFISGGLDALRRERL